MATQSGSLAQVLSKVAAYYGRQKQLWDKLVSAVTYPILMICIGMIVVSILMAFVVPKITDMLEDQGQTLPPPTQLLVNVSEPARMDVPSCRKSTKRPSPNSPYTTEGMPAKLMIASRIARVNQLSGAYSAR